MATQTYEIPLSPEAQKFGIVLAAITYQMVVRYIDADMGGWVFDLSDSSDTPILQGIPLVTGENLLAQFDYLNFGGSMVVQTDHDLNAVPTYDNLGSTSHLYFQVVDG